MDGWEQTSGPDGFVSVSDGQLRVDGTRNGHNTSTSGNSTVYGFENEAADTGIPERFDPIVDPRGRGFSRNGDDAVTPDVYADGTQAYYGLERASGNVLYIRPREQPLSEPRTEPVSVALNRPDTYGDGTKGTAGILLYERVAPSNEPPIRVVHNDGKLRAINGESLTTLQPGVFGQWVHVDIFAIDLTNDTYSVRWTSPVGDGVRHNLDMAGAMTSGYRTSILSADGEAYLDNLVIRESNTSTCQGTQGSTASTPQCSSPTVVTRTFILPEDADAADLQVNATASGEGTAEVTAMRYPSNSETVSVGSGEWSHTFSSVLADDAHDVPDAGGPQQAPENDTVTLRVRANGTQVNVSSVKLALDTDGDGLTDNRERAGVPTAQGDISTSPYERDSDGDGLSDMEELGKVVTVSENVRAGGLVWHVEREGYALESLPNDPDSDRDGLDDKEEQTVGTDVFEKDSDSDGMPDGTDPRPLIDDQTPEVTIEGFNGFDESGPTVTIVVEEASDIESVSVKAAYLRPSANQVRPSGSTLMDLFSFREADAISREQINDTQTRYVFAVPTEYDVRGRPPAGLIINVTDENRNQISVPAVTNADNPQPATVVQNAVARDYAVGGGQSFVFAGGAVASTGNLPSGLSGASLPVSVSTAAGGALLVGSVAITVVAVDWAKSNGALRLAPRSGTRSSRYLRSAVESTVSINSETAGVQGTLEVPLSEGYVGLTASVATGFGVAHVSETSDLTRTDIEQAASNAIRGIKDGNQWYIIGQTNQDELVVILLQGTALVAASQYATIRCRGSQSTPVVRLAKEGQDVVEDGVSLSDVIEIADGVATNTGGECVDLGERNRQPDVSNQEVTFFDMQKGQSVLVESGGENVLIDAGSKSDIEERYLGDLYEELDGEDGETVTIDRLIITHGHDDHVKFVDDIISNSSIEIEEVYWNQVREANPDADRDDQNPAGSALEAILAAEASGDLTYREDVELDGRSNGGDVIEAGGTDFDIVNPEQLDEEDGDSDSESLAITITIDEQTFHIATDSHENNEVQTEEDDVDVTTAMHHGSSNSETGTPDNTVEWFEGMNPTHVVLQVSDITNQDHPTDDTLNNINRVDSVEHLYISDEHEGVTFTVIDDTLAVNTTTNAPTDPSHWAPEASQGRIAPAVPRQAGR